MRKFKGTEQDFEKWKKQWRKEQKVCDKFKCCHEAMACGISIRCGDCSIYSYQKDVGCINICRDASCEDCVFRFECKEKKTLMMRGKERCGYCDGTGVVTKTVNKYGHGQECGKCGGTGKNPDFK